MQFIIRPAIEQDAPFIYALIRELAVYEKLDHELKMTEEELRQALFSERPMAECHVGCLGDEIAAYTIFFHNFSTFHAKRGLYLEDLYVRPQYRGKGYGQILLRHLANIAIQRDCSRFEWIVLDWNEGGIRFYERLGASIQESFRVCRVDGQALINLASAGESSFDQEVI